MKQATRVSHIIFQAFVVYLFIFNLSVFAQESIFNSTFLGPYNFNVIEAKSIYIYDVKILSGC